jgi:pimeloyl-ACP methyl ester carboxylesterase
MNGKPFSSSTPLSLFGYRRAYSTQYTWGTTGLDAPFIEFYDAAPPALPPPDPCAVAGACASNVMFLQGIEGTRLYEGVGCGKGAEEKLWEPYEGLWSTIIRGGGDDKMRDLFLTASGESECDDVYVKQGDVIDTIDAPSGGRIYQSFVDEMNELKTAGDINDWESVAYDWRLSLDDLLEKGAARGGNIYYAEATSTPYIEQTLRALAGSSKTGKVTIVAHSNGGLVAKALLDKLGSGTAALLVDKLILVGAPQSGAPEALGSTLVGHNAGIYAMGLPIVSNAVAREFAQNSPMAYHLLPSADYLASTAGDADHPIARFAGDGYTKEIDAYGATVDTLAELDDYLLASEGGRSDPATSDVRSPEILNASLISYANTKHAALDSWAPPAGIAVSQIAGWGSDTIAGIDFFTPLLADAITALAPARAYRPIFTEDGDGVVPTPSALMMNSSASVKRYWVDLGLYYKETDVKIEHKNLFEIPSLETFIKNLIKNSTSTLPAYISTTQPPSTSDKKLVFTLHSPLTLQITDASGNVTGIGQDDVMTQDIPDSSYGEFGDVKYVIVPEGGSYSLALHGQASGTFMLEMQELTGSVVTASSTIVNVPVNPNTLASMTISGGLDTASPLSVYNGVATVSITPKIGESVSYVAPRSRWRPAATVPPTSPDASQGTATQAQTSTPTPLTSVVEAPTPDVVAEVASSTLPIVVVEPVATTTPEVATSTPVVVAKKKTRPSLALAPQKKGSEDAPKNIRQTAAAYDAVSQQPLLSRLGSAFYNGLYGFWSVLKKLF